MQNLNKQLSLFIGILLMCGHTYASASGQVAELLQDSKVPTYDCPDNEYIKQINDALSDKSLQQVQRHSLTVRKTHWQICQGKHTDAKQQLIQIVSMDSADKNQEYYANALYQLGFLYDVQESPERCQYYQEAKQRAEDKFPDIALSSELGLLTVCEKGKEDGIKLGKMYALLESYSNQGNQGAVAHIHNSIGLFYGVLGQQVLAAEQFRKSYELGLGTYTGSNQLATLISVISSQLAAGDFNAAKSSIDEFKEVNKQINTPQTNVWLHFAEAGYYYRLDNYQELANSLARWEVYMPQINNPLFEGFHRWYSAKLCLVEEDQSCLEAFLQAEETTSSGYKSLVNSNKDYLKFRVEIDLFLGDLDKVKVSFNRFSDVLIKQFMDRQEAGKILGVANLHSQIINLENSLAEAQRKQTRNVVWIVGLVVLLMAIIIYFLRLRSHGKKSYDLATKLLDRKAALNAIRNVSKPAPGKINALALFDLANFKLVNRDIGSIDGDFVLQKIAASLVSATREQDILGRIEEQLFVVCLTNIEEHTANSFFERTRMALETSIQGNVHGQPVNMKSSMSIYISNDNFADLDDVIQAMQVSLNKGKQ